MTLRDKSFGREITVKHVLRDGSTPDSIEGHIVTATEGTALMHVINRIESQKGKEVAS